MFDFHLHSSVSFDSQTTATEMANAAVAAGLREICFTDHYDYNSDPQKQANLFTLDQYHTAYDDMCVQGLTIRKGVEFGLTCWNAPHLKALIRQYPFDFVIGSLCTLSMATIRMRLRIGRGGRFHKHLSGTFWKPYVACNGIMILTY